MPFVYPFAAISETMAAMRLADLFNGSDVVLDLSCATKADVLRAVAYHLSRNAGMPPAQIQKELAAREELGSTGVGGGLALPHARIAGVTASHAVLVRLAAPIDFAAIDAAPVDLVCALIAPPEPRQEALAALSAISKALRDEARVARLRAAADPPALYAALLS